VVALVRDAHRHAWVGTRLAELASRCPTLVTVEMGWPGSSRLPGAATVWTHGASRASGAALDGLLARSAGPGSDRAAGQLRDEP
jgi:beta-N-acetylhexosaminidase